VISPVAQRAERLLKVPAPEALQSALMVGLADLHNVGAWSAFASHDDDTARYHFASAMMLGNAGDGRPVRELYTSRACQRRSAARVKLMHSVRAPRRLTGRNAYTRTGSVDQRRHGVCAGTDGRTHCRAQSTDQSARGMACAAHVDDQADMDWATALTEMYLDRTDVAERLVSNAVGRWNDSHDRRQAVLGRITLAQLHVQAGDSRGVELAARATNEVRELRPTRAHRPRVDAIKARARAKVLGPRAHRPPNVVNP
jgi:hypothetical protein